MADSYTLIKSEVENENPYLVTFNSADAIYELTLTLSEWRRIGEPPEIVIPLDFPRHMDGPNPLWFDDYEDDSDVDSVLSAGG